jgi:predicted DNA-binding protein YlxM (UPF0122 family)
MDDRLTTKRKLKSKESDSRSINIDDDYALDFWAKELNVSKKKIKDAVSIAGNSVSDVKRELKK